MNIVYILRSEKNGKLYIGRTSRDLETRIKEHNTNGIKWTTGKGPFRLLCFETYDTEQLASQRERFLKTGKGRRVLANKINALSGKLPQSSTI